jgi:hypothetical protein
MGEEVFKFIAGHGSDKDVDIYDYGFSERVTIIDGHSLWPDRDWSEPDPSYIVKNISEKFEGRQPGRIILNLEHWPWLYYESDEVRKETVRKFIVVVEALKEALPTSEIGIYSILPIQDYWAPVVPERIPIWQEKNDQFKELAALVDYIAPSIYAFYDDQDHWVEYATANINQALRYGKPVYPYLWPRFHDSHESLGKTKVPDEFWELMVRTVARLTDGALFFENIDLGAEWFAFNDNILSDIRDEKTQNQILDGEDDDKLSGLSYRDITKANGVWVTETWDGDTLKMRIKEDMLNAKTFDKITLVYGDEFTFKTQENDNGIIKQIVIEGGQKVAQVLSDTANHKDFMHKGVLFDEQGHVALIAKVMDDATLTISIKGTPLAGFSDFDFDVQTFDWLDALIA